MYREFPSIAPGVLCTWERSVLEGGAVLVVPDGCVDVVWFGDGRIEVAGPDARSRVVAVSPGEIVGVRFAPAMARQFLGVPIEVLKGAQPDLGDLSPALLETTRRLEGGTWTSTHSRRRGLEEGLLRWEPWHDPMVQAATRDLLRDPSIRVEVLAEHSGISTRQLRRRFVKQVGYGPKVFARVARLHRFLAITGEESDLGLAAAIAGYASQSHMSDEVRELTSLTPVRFVEAWGGAAP